jgi:hypothetical protein
MQTILEVNKSVSDMLEQITDMQLVLISKLNKILKCIPPNPEPPHCRSQTGSAAPPSCPLKR